MADLITSRQNPLVKQLEAIRDDRKSPLMFLEGPRLVEEVLKTKLSVEILVWTKSMDGNAVLESAKQTAKGLFKVSDSIFRTISDVDAPQGVLAIARCPKWNWKDIVGKPGAPILVLDGIQDPGNLSSIIRTAEAAGAAGVITTAGSAHIYVPKALRGAAGSSLRLPCLEHQAISDIASKLKEAHYQVLAAQARKEAETSLLYTEIDWNWPVAFVLGQEGQGFSKEWQGKIDRAVHLPMEAPVESLNVAVAAAVFLYEAHRVRSR